MSKTLTATVSALIAYLFSDVEDIATVRENQVGEHTYAYTSGKGAGKLNTIYRAEFTLTTGSPTQDLNLRTILDPVNEACEFEQVKLILVKNLATTVSDDIKIGPQSVANGFIEPWNDAAAGVNVVQPGGCLLIDAPNDGFDVESTEAVIRLAYAGTSGSIDVEIWIAGTSGDLEESSSSSSESSSSSSSSSQSSSSQSSSSQSSSSLGVSSSSCSCSESSSSLGVSSSSCSCSESSSPSSSLGHSSSSCSFSESSCSSP